MNPRVRIVLGIVVVAAILVAVFARGRGEETAVIASGTVETTEAALGFLTAGRIDSIGVQEGATVAQGDQLAWLDGDALEASRQAAAAQLRSARARLQELEAGFRSEEVAQGRAALRAADERLADARREAERAERLFEGGAISEQQRDRAATALEVAAAEQSRAAEQALLFERGYRSEQVATQRAIVAQAEASLAQVDAQLAHTVIVAPFDGTVTVRHREPGEVVGAGVAVLTVRDPSDRWVRIYVPENRVGQLSLGQPATITADAYPDAQYDGTVTFIADEAEFTPRNVQTSEERVKLVFRVKVRINTAAADALKPGLPADVRMETPRER